MTNNAELQEPAMPGSDRVWRVATWSTVLLFQGVVGLFLAAMLIQTKLGVRADNLDVERHEILVAAAVATLMTLVASLPLLISHRPVARGIGLGLSTSATIFAIGVVAFVLWLY